jgi:hypothetical protein
MYTFSHEVKGNLARLLATENLIVEHKQVPTASFDVENRVLTLPMWQKASSTVYDLLVGHEVGHALFTPNLDWREGDYKKVPPSFVNVVEDARIERMMKRKFPGFAKTFHKGYKELSDDDFFSIADENLSDMNLIDRINIHFKVGMFAAVPFEGEEKEFVELVETTESFDDVLDVSKKLYEYMKSKSESDKPIDFPEVNATPKEGAPTGNTTEIEVDTPEQSQSDATGDSGGVSEGDVTPSSDTQASSNKGGESFDEFESQTNAAFEENQKKLINHSLMETTYIEFPKVVLNKLIIPAQDIATVCSEYYDSDFFNAEGTYRKSIYDSAVADYHLYRKEAARGVNYLVKEFECKKSADAYSRAATSRTGVLDTTKLHTYKFNDDLFKKVTILPDGKNHGLIFILDWSGSMQDVILDTVKQLLNLVWFCKKVNIPFEVYAFTYDYVNERENYEDDGSEIQIMEANTLYLYRSFRLLNMLSHKRKSADFEQDCRNLWKVAYLHQRRAWECIPHGLGLSGTPLNETLVALRQIVPEFIEENNLSKVNTVILTDGESAGIARVAKTKDYWDDSKDRFGRLHINQSCQIRDRKLGLTYQPTNENTWKGSMTNILLTNLNDNFPQVNFIGIRILPSRDVRGFFQLYLDQYDDQTKRRWSKERSFVIKDNGYSALYAIASNTLNESDEFNVEDDATMTQIRNAFKKSLKAKAMNKKVLSSFISMVA